MPTDNDWTKMNRLYHHHHHYHPCHHHNRCSCGYCFDCGRYAYYAYQGGLWTYPYGPTPYYGTVTVTNDTTSQPTSCSHSH